MEENEVIEDDLGFKTVRAPLAKFDTIESLLLRSSSEESDGEDVKSVLSVKAAPQLQISSAQRDSDSTLGTPTPTAEKSFTEHLNGDSGSRRTPTTPESAGSGASSGAGQKHSGFSKLFSKFVSPVTHGLASTFHLGKAHEAKHDKLEQLGDQNEVKSRAKTASPNIQAKSTQKKSLKRPAPPPPVINDATANKPKIHELIRQGNIENESSSISEDDAKEKVLGLAERRSSVSSESSGDTIKGSAAPAADASTPEEEGAHGLLHQDSIEYEESVDFELLPNSSRQTTLIVRADRSKYEFESKPIERPRSATPLQPVPLDEYLKVDLRTVKSEEKLNIILPGEEFVLDKPRAPRRQIDNKTWMNFCAQSLSPRHRSLSGPPEQYSDDASNTIPRLPKTLPPAKTFRKRAASSPSSSSSSTPDSPEKLIETSDINVVNDTFLTSEAFGPEADGDHSSWVASFDQAVGIIPTVEVTSPPLSRSSRSSSEGSSSRRSSSSSETPTEIEKPNEEPNKHSDSGVVMCNGESQVDSKKQMISAKKKDKKKKKHGDLDDDFDFDIPAQNENQPVNINKDSEEWRKFQELTERAKEVASKTQCTLDQLGSSSVSDYLGNFRYDVVKEDVQKRKAVALTDKNWVDFDDGNTFQVIADSPLLSDSALVDVSDIPSEVQSKQQPNGVFNKDLAELDLVQQTAYAEMEPPAKPNLPPSSKKPTRPPPPRRRSTQEQLADLEKLTWGPVTSTPPPKPPPPASSPAKPPPATDIPADMSRPPPIKSIFTKSDDITQGPISIDDFLDFGFGSSDVSVTVTHSTSVKTPDVETDLFDLGTDAPPKPPPPSPQHEINEVEKPTTTSDAIINDLKMFESGDHSAFSTTESALNGFVTESKTIGKSGFKDIFGGVPSSEVASALDPFRTSFPAASALSAEKATLDVQRDLSDAESAVSDVDGLHPGEYEPLGNGADLHDEDDDPFGLGFKAAKSSAGQSIGPEVDFGSDLFGEKPLETITASEPSFTTPSKTIGSTSVMQKVDNLFADLEQEPVDTNKPSMFSDDLFHSAADGTSAPLDENDPFIVPSAIRDTSTKKLESSNDPFVADSSYPSQPIANDPFSAPVEQSDGNAGNDVFFSNAMTDKFDFDAFSSGDEATKDIFMGAETVVPAKRPKTKTSDQDSIESPLYEEDTSEPLPVFQEPWTGDGWEMMLRQPNKKKMTGQRFWQKVYVRVVRQNILQLFNKAEDHHPFQELPLQACYSLSPLGLQQYDEFTKVHTVKLQYVFYKERVGIHGIHGTIQSGIQAITEMIRPKHALPLEHAPQTSALMKLGTLNYDDIRSFVMVIEDALFHLSAQRERSLTYKQDEITMTVIDELKCHVDTNVVPSAHNARVRLFCLAFLSGMPEIEVGVNDKRREGKEIVGRKDIIPVKTEEWIRLEECEFHSVVDKEEFEKTKVIKYKPLDGCQFEILRFRVRPPKNREMPLQPKIIWRMKGQKVEIRCEVMVPGYCSRKHGQVPCEDIQIRIPIPEEWIYLFRVEKRFRYGSKHSAHRKPGKIKGLERVLGAAQTLLPQLIEASVGIAKYERLFRSLVWRISRLPEKHHSAYATQLMVCRLETQEYDNPPESYPTIAYAEFTMPATTVSHTTVRSVSVASQEPPEKFLRQIARYEMTIDIEQDLDTGVEIPDPSQPIITSKETEEPEAGHEGDNSSSDGDSSS